MRPYLGAIPAIVLITQSAFTPARLRDSAVPPIPFQAVGGGEVFLELSVDAHGVVQDVTTLRATPPFTESMTSAVRAWRFDPAVEKSAPQTGRRGELAKAPIASTVLAAGMFRPPTLNTPTIGEQPRRGAAASDGTPVPLTTVMPPFPPLARDSGVVLLEVRVDDQGRVAAANVVRSAPPFDQPALEAVRQWTFRRAKIRGTPVEALAYVLFGFRAPLDSAGHLEGRH